GGGASRLWARGEGYRARDEGGGGQAPIDAPARRDQPRAGQEQGWQQSEGYCPTARESSDEGRGSRGGRRLDTAREPLRATRGHRGGGLPELHRRQATEGRGRALPFRPGAGSRHTGRRQEDRAMIANQLLGPLTLPELSLRLGLPLDRIRREARRNEALAG